MAYDTNGWNGGNGPMLFTNVRVLDATGGYPYTGDVLIGWGEILLMDGNMSVRVADLRVAELRDGTGRDGSEARAGRNG